MGGNVPADRTLRKGRRKEVKQIFQWEELYYIGELHKPYVKAAPTWLWPVLRLLCGSTTEQNIVPTIIPSICRR